MRMRYVVSRVGLVAALTVALYFGGLPWWGAVAAGVLVLAFFLAAPRSGRYVVQREGSVAPLRRDERSRAIRDKAARNAFVLTLLSVAGLTIVYGRVFNAPVPVAALGGVLGAAAVAYAVSELCLRRMS
jgi:hypothetical protein